MYAKAHPLGYKKVATPVNPYKNFRNSKKHTQAVVMRLPYEVAERKAKRNPETGKLEFEPVYKGVGKNRKLVTNMYYNTVVRTIQHYD